MFSAERNRRGTACKGKETRKFQITNLSKEVTILRIKLVENIQQKSVAYLIGQATVHKIELSSDPQEAVRHEH